MSVLPRFSPSVIEPLEARIAPALLVHGANLLGGAGNPSTGESSLGDTALTLVKVLSGQAVVWYDGTSIVGISFGPNARLEVSGSVEGDIVGNLTAEGRLSDTDNNPLNGEDGNVLLPNNLLGLKVQPLSGDPGSVGIVDSLGKFGKGLSIITGGSVSNVDVNFVLGGIYAGDGVFNLDSAYNQDTPGTVAAKAASDIDVNPVEPGIQTGFTFTTAVQATADRPLTAGASISNVTVGKALAMQLISGSGMPPGTVAGSVGADGGNISNVTIDVAGKPDAAPDSTFSYQLIAGDGGIGAKGGAGGTINKVIERASSGKADMQAGQGGVGTAGPGGAGGSVLNIDLQSGATAYTVKAGDGGQGTPGGAGGNVQFGNFSNRTANSGLVFAGDFTGDGLIDVAIVDGGTGSIVISQQAADGSFSQVTQYVDITDPMNPVEVKVIASPGSLPSDGAAVDVDGDTDLDLVVAYKGSTSVVVLFNTGTGSFYDSADPMNPVLQASSAALFGSPNAIDIDPANPDRIVAAGEGTVNGKLKGSLELLTLVPNGMGGLALGRVGSETVFDFPLTDAALTRADSGFSGVIVSQKNGDLFTTSFAQQPPDQLVPAFENTVLFEQIAGGVRRIEISSDGKALAVLGPASFGVGIYDLTGLAPNVDTVAFLPAAGGGNPAVMRFVDDGIDDTPDTLFLLSNGTGASRITQYIPDGVTTTGYVIGRVFDSSDVFRNFSGFGTAASAGFAAVTGALNVFSFSPDFTTVSTQTLPFAGKTVTVGAGNGGAGVESGTKIGNGGAGGSIMSINAEAFQISLTAGDGGNTQMGAGGAGGSLINPATFIPASGGGAVAPHIVADNAISLVAGAGGTPALNATTAAGGNGGSMRGLNIDLVAGDLSLNGGAGGNSRGGKAGAGGNLADITTVARDGNLTAAAGAGGVALASTGAGGAGGTVTNFNHTLLLAAETEAAHRAYTVSISGGAGGGSIGAGGGAGGGLSGITLDLDNSDIDVDNLSGGGLDGTTNPVTIALSGGAGANGTIGGSGGSISGLNYTSHNDQILPGGSIFIGYFTMSITAGDGGEGSAGAGGAGGSFTGGKPISGITGYDPDGPAPMIAPLAITAGDGGNGTKAGGVGGVIRNIATRNALSFDGRQISGNHLTGAELIAGSGGNASAGNGGAGGGIFNSLIGVDGTALLATAGSGGNGVGTAQAKGGVGGAIQGGTYGLIRSDFVGDLTFSLVSGGGGNGAAAGGAGGVVSNLVVNIQQASDTAGGLSILAAGNGGAASNAGGKGGKGGAISSISQSTGLNSVITALFAGNGGDAAGGTGGAGGNVSGVKTSGFIGQPSDSTDGGTDRYGVFNPDFATGIPQGIFVGRGGVGSSATLAGKAGSVSNVTARQIAAIAALSATPGLFVPAEKVSNVKADLIGYDTATIGVFDGAAGAPQTGVPIDGFILAKAISQVTGTHLGFVFDV